MTRRLTVSVVAATIAVMSGCAQPGTPQAPADTIVEPSEWRAVPAGPLSARDRAVAVWTGDEVLVIGGAADMPCPVGADCVAPTTVLNDGAAYDPEQRTWRTIAPAPGPVWAERAILAGGTVYVHSRDPKDFGVTLIAYDVTADAWTTPPALPAGQDMLAAAGDRLVAYAGSHENGATGTGYVLTGGRWEPLPRDPLGDGFDRRFAWADGVLVLLDRELVPNPGSDGPALVRAAVLADPFTAGATWTRISGEAVQYTDPLLVDGDRIVLPIPGTADGGEVNPWTKPYPFGGVLDLATRTWSELPATDQHESVGAFGPTAALYTGHEGVVLDVERARWLTTPPLPGKDQHLTDPAVTAAGRDLFVFGGAVWAGDRPGRMQATGWIWTP
jgi:hypothetical protein